MKRFVAAVAMAPLCFAAAEARAQTTVTDARTTPAVTSTTGDLTITATGTITVTSGTAVTVDTPATVISSGQITINDAPGAATGILVTSGSGAITSAGVISVGDTDTPKDTDGDGIPDGPFATSAFTRYGIHVVNPYTGAVTQSGVINIRGNNSAAVAIDGPLTGNLDARGTINLIGANSFGVHAAGPVVGNVTLGAVSVQGAGSVAAALDGMVTGRVTLNGTLSATGFRFVTRPIDSIVAKLGADDLELGGPALRIGASITGGLLVNAPPTETDAANDDEDGDGISDLTETAVGTVTSTGSAPAILIGAPTAIALGNVGTGRSAYGVVIQGSAQGSGVFDGVTTTGVQLGGLGGTVDTGGGVRVDGAITANSLLANATALSVGSGTTAPVISNGGTIAARSSSSATVAPNVTAISIGVGASTPRLDNSGTIVASINGAAGVTTAVRDSSGTLTQITNTGAIVSGTTPTDASLTTTGRPIALDLRANTAGVTVTQSLSSVTSAVAPTMTGDIRFGSGSANLQLLSGALTGAVSFGSGANVLNVDGGATLTGGLSNTGSLAMSIGKGTVLDDSATVIRLNSLTVGSEGTLGFKLDPSATDPTARNSQFLVSGAANFAAGAKINVGFGSKLTTTTTYNLLRATSLASAGIDTSLIGSLPFFYKGTLSTTATEINVTVARRTAAEAGVTGSRANAFEAVFANFDSDIAFGNRLLGKTDQAGFASLYNQLLPDYSGGAFHSLATGTREAMRAQAEDPQDMPANQRRSWLQEVGFSTRNKGDGQDIPYDSAGFGIIGGMERADLGRGTIGLSAGFISSDVDNANRQAESRLTASTLLGSVYWRDKLADGIMLNASATGGYAWFDSDRDVIDLDSTQARVLVREAGGKWQGALAAARFGVTYDAHFGKFYVRPDALIDYVYLYENGYRERGGGTAVDLTVNSRTSYEGSVEAGVTVGAQYGRTFRWGPEFRVAYRGILASGLSDTAARFTSGGAFFNLRSLAVDKNRLLLRLALRGGSRYANIALEATGDIGNVYTAYEGRLIVRFLF